MSFLLIDLDHFKKINHRYGHDCGDSVLQHFTSIVRDQLTPESHCLRLGGEEFGIFLAATAPDDAKEFANKLRNLVANSVIKYKHSVVQFTISIGLAHKPSGQTMEIRSILSVADKALYEAKNAGRNTVAQAA